MIGWEKVSFLAVDSRFNHRRIKESLLIDCFAHRSVMNIEEGMKKDVCWNVFFLLLCKEFSELSGM